MKVILRADVENLGKLGDIVEVRPGYGRNFLLPQGMAMAATASNMKVFEMERRKLQAEMDAVRATATTLAEKIAAADVSIAVRVGENDKLYGSVTPAHIADALAEAGVEIDRRRILLDAPIRNLGEYDVRVRLHADVEAVIALKVVAEGRTEEADAEESAAEEPAVEEAAE
ncbi:50S ribosomal protein L9 [Oleidesulfovibrio alaskensis]|uniref:Large ribosomal subunit protein bL9 n=1 Tax=Oleidesulfovibrio alaskensis (strain ATCC BAA-1058 / DSM 17464 / G20) TaxID=207559 RepID=RL9_OLEA2|nr:50S ribosomal protein L9 [Oleidesulfovibrio alaskensis]Q312D7.2 RecName: Full=Large ribosomal subunit protein bL9; AltName: Full=50S ribosomal protein L9 [Oleidesulfovibrio alaskensis G20]MBG0774417.1 50S ribosomal protein L9 [Oleidesulfovibrio alaskensis]MBL3581151.1 50S ribosomal protein L9 [Oleidesulfovibrio alaskensis]